MSRPDPDDEAVTLASHLRASSDKRVRRFRLRIVQGPEAGRELVVDESLPPRVLLGQSPACELRLVDREVSRRHVALSLAGARLRVVDQGSTNGTFVDGVLVHDVELAGGETVRIGTTKLRVEADADADAVSIPPAESFGRLQGTSEPMRRLFATLEQLAHTTAPVVIEGEAGTGKELCAEALHERGPRADKPLVVLDCTATPPGEIDADAVARAAGGTLLVDEIAALDRAAQGKLLRAIESTDARLLVTTRRDLDREVQEGRFRDDLFFRVMIARVEIPPLRARRDDVPLLANTFWSELGEPGEIPRARLDEWRDAPWPANVRELANAVARLAALGDARIGIGPKAVPAPATSEPSGADPIDRVLAMRLPLSGARELVIREFERRYVERITAEHGGNVTRAAKSAGVTLRYFQLLRARLS